jgi:hypothetical protein
MNRPKTNESSDANDSQPKEIQQALVRFTDFIYAGVFALIVRQLFNDILNKDFQFICDHSAQLVLLLVLFYFLSWDWALGRLLTIRIPYQRYTRFYCELLIAAFAYGTASAAVMNSLMFLVHLALVLLAGVFWANRTRPYAKEKRDKRELCVIQNIQVCAAITFIILYLFRRSFFDDAVSWALVLSFLGLFLTFLFAYEAYTPRMIGLEAGPGVAFIRRSDVRRFRKFLERLPPSITRHVDNH